MALFTTNLIEIRSLRFLAKRKEGGAGGVIAVLSWTPILPLDLFNYIYLIFSANNAAN